MGRYETIPVHGTASAIRPFMPDSLCASSHFLTPEATSALAKAASDIQRLEARLHASSSTQLILQAEALASARLEGYGMDAEELLLHRALARAGKAVAPDVPEYAVCSCIAALDAVLADRDKVPDIDMLCQIDSLVLRETDFTGTAGQIRTKQSWISTNPFSPIGADYVCPRPELVPSCLDDLLQFIAASPLPAAETAALSYAQFETIHPFADGNGRTGRILVQSILAESGKAAFVPIPISLIFASEKERSVTNLAAYRWNEEDGQQSQAIAESDWIEYFASTLCRAVERTEHFSDALEGLLTTWRQELRPRAHSAKDLLLPCLAGHPCLTVGMAARLIGRSPEAARLALRELSRQGVAKRMPIDDRQDLYIARDILSAFHAFADE